jgi:23S rRNA pseudouridine1911/1915/1917 synthase
MGGKRCGIVYEDDWIIVAEKPSGMLTIPTPKGETNTLTDLLNRELDNRGIEANAYPCHRLDRDTSGLILYAKGKAIQQKMMESFKKRLVKKTYTAFVQGDLKTASGVIRARIYNRNKNRSEEAVTNYRVIDRWKDFSVVEVEPLTGRTNQIRIHMKSIGHPLVGERIYAFRKDYKLKFRRAALHAAKLEFDHPVNGDRVNFTAPLAEDMKNFLRNTMNDER